MIIVYILENGDETVIITFLVQKFEAAVGDWTYSLEDEASENQ